MKQKEMFTCTGCGWKSPMWVGQCSGCQQWNSLEKQSIISGKLNTISKEFDTPAKLHPLDDIDILSEKRLVSGIREWDRVTGGGILPGSFLALTGDPGIGKSTLLLQIGHALCSKASVLYFSSEESLAQVKSRATRLSLDDTTMLFSDEYAIERIVATISREKPDLVIIDSIQSCRFASNGTMMPGGAQQLREASLLLMRTAKELGVSIIITGHITKDGTMAGPKLLEHMVDAVFYLQAEERWQMRLLRAVKNRFGAVNEVGFFHMAEQGLEEVVDINRQLLTEATFSPGAALICSYSGSRPLLLEAQALCIESRFGSPQRVMTGIEHRRVVLIAAILEKYLKIKLSAYDIFFKVGGGVFVKESGSDLGVALALLSSFFQKPLPIKSLALGEMTLTGHIRPAQGAGLLAAEAIKFGITNIISPPDKSLQEGTIAPVKTVYDLLRFFPEE